MAASDLTLDRLQQQVQSGSCRIATACSRLENVVQNLCRDEMTRPFLTVLPRILSMLFGDEHNAGWIETANDEESMHYLWSLLKPSGTIFSAALTHSGQDIAPFELPASQLPVHLGSCIYHSTLIIDNTSEAPSKSWDWWPSSAFGHLRCEYLSGGGTFVYYAPRCCRVFHLSITCCFAIIQTAWTWLFIPITFQLHDRPHQIPLFRVPSS